MAQNTVNEAIAALKAGNKTKARSLLVALLDGDPQNEDAWLVLSAAVDDPQQKQQCLETVLELNPDNHVARRGLERLQTPAEQIEEAAAQPPAPPDATVAAADPQPAQPAPADAAEEPSPLPSFEQTTAEAETGAEAPLDAAARAPAPPDAVAAAETPPPDAQTIAENQAGRRQQRTVAIIGIVVGVLLIIMIIIFAALVILARGGI